MDNILVFSITAGMIRSMLSKILISNNICMGLYIMYITHIPSVKKMPLKDIHGDDCLYQIFFENDEMWDSKKPESMRAFMNFSMIELKPGATNKMHTHEDCEQVYFILEGGGLIQVGDESQKVKKGDAIFLPAQIPHEFTNNTEKTSIILMIGSSTYQKIEGKNELIRHLIATLVYRTTKIIHDAPKNFPKTSIGNGVRTPLKILGHINSLIQLSNRFWSPHKPKSMAKLRKQSDKKGWDREVALFYQLVAQFDDTLSKFTSPRLYSPEKILQGPFMDAFTHIGQLALLRRMAGSSIKGESYWMAEVKVGRVGPNQPLRV
jgi:mannose-6-phosphate isomerase-like protein (cupin superfamily)